jgi:hemerythrin-like domain-containing protein
MDALEILKQMHEEAKSAFQKIESAGADQRGDLWKKLEPELKMHEQLEERCVYDPAHQEHGDDQMLSDWHTRHHEEVGQAEQMIGRISGMDHHNDRWLQMVRDLHHTLEQHIQMEEGTIWPHIREVWGGRLDQAGQEMERMKSQGMGRAA